ncbi:MAG: hypothetical protein AABX79_00535 [Nanoarchaeota archaeon]
MGLKIRLEDGRFLPLMVLLAVIFLSLAFIFGLSSSTITAIVGPDECELCVRYADNNGRASAPWQCSQIGGSVDTDFVGNVDRNDDFDVRVNCTDSKVQNSFELCRRYADNNGRASAPWQCANFGIDLLTDFVGDVDSNDDLDFMIRPRTGVDPSTVNPSCMLGVRYADLNGRASAPWRYGSITGVAVQTDFVGEVDSNDDFDLGIFSCSALLIPPPQICGNGVCESGLGENSTTCPQDCPAPVPTCGNGVPEAGEQCDDGNSNNNDACKNDCTNNICGDGVIHTGVEQCDSTDLGGQTCQSLNFTGGILNCTASCTFNTSSCTTPPPSAPTCVLNSSSWDITQTIEGNVVGLHVITSNCQGQTISIAVRESDVFPPDTPANINPADTVVASDGTATGTWTAEWINDGFAQGNPEYIFTASLVSNPGTNIDSSNQLEVLQITPPFCQSINTCGNYLNQSDCQNDICNVASNSVPASVDCNDPNTSCSCVWNNTATTCGPAVAVATINVTTNTTSNIGTCYYAENTADTCDDDGFLTVDLNATWIWDAGCDATCQTDNQGAAASCQSTTESFQCPTQIPLPFFNIYNMLAAVILIALIYWAISMRKRRKNTGKRAGRKYPD